MCGIFGCVSKKVVEPQLILSSLKNLEYRGYDSWGVAAMHKGVFAVEKKVGKISDNKLSLQPTTLAVGHTRWATHGGVVVANSHPHLSADRKLAVIHNGIIENHLELWQELEAGDWGGRQKPVKKSETDSEVFVHLISFLLPKYGIVESVRRAFQRVEGLSAFVVADVESQQLVAIKTGSPLVIGLSVESNYIASDAQSLLDYTDRVIFLDDGQMVVISAGEAQCFDAATGKSLTIAIEKLDWQQTVADQGRYDHFSLKEIHEQPNLVRTIANEFDSTVAGLAKLIQEHTKVYLVGCGTASYAALYGSYVLSRVAGVEVRAISGSEMSSVEQFMTAGSLVVFFSQSGETIDIIQPLKRVKKQGATTAALVNVHGSSLDRLADHSFLLKTGQEVAVMSTKALMAMITVMSRVAAHLAGDDESLKKLLLTTAAIQTTIVSTTYLQRSLMPVVEVLKRAAHCYVIGRGQSFPIALEAALKLKEVGYLHAEGFAGGELKHGVIALIEKNTPCLVFAPDDENYSTIISNATEIKARGGLIIGVAAKAHPIFDMHLPVVETNGVTYLAQVVVAQLLAYHLSVAKGIDPDKPRNLAKCVTVV